MMTDSKVRTARNLTGMTQIQLADVVHVSESTIKRIEQGTQKPDYMILDAIAEATGCPWVANPFVPENYQPMAQSQAFVSLYSTVQHINSVLPTMAEILADGVVDAGEQKAFKNCLAVIDRGCKAQADFIYAR